MFEAIFIYVKYNYALTDISDLSNLADVGGDFKVYSNSALTDISGFRNLTDV